MIITPRRVTIIITSLFTVLVCSVSPVYCVNRYGWRFSPRRNKTILGLVFTDNKEIVEKFSYAANNIVVPFSAFLVVIVCTITLVIKLQSKTKWREKSAASVQATTMSNRDQKVTRMVVVISTMFIICFFPVCVIFIALLFEPELSVLGRYKNTAIVLIGVGFLLESTNSSVNIFLYYHMSTRYRAVFRKLFRLRQQQSIDTE